VAQEKKNKWGGGKKKKKKKKGGGGPGMGKKKNFPLKHGHLRANSPKFYSPTGEGIKTEGGLFFVEGNNVTGQQVNNLHVETFGEVWSFVFETGTSWFPFEPGITGLGKRYIVRTGSVENSELIEGSLLGGISWLAGRVQKQAACFTEGESFPARIKWKNGVWIQATHQGDMAIIIREKVGGREMGRKREDHSHEEVRWGGGGKIAKKAPCGADPP